MKAPKAPPQPPPPAGRAAPPQAHLRGGRANCCGEVASLPISFTPWKLQQVGMPELSGRVGRGELEGFAEALPGFQEWSCCLMLPDCGSCPQNERTTESRACQGSTLRVQVRSAQDATWDSPLS